MAVGLTLGWAFHDLIVRWGFVEDEKLVQVGKCSLSHDGVPKLSPLPRLVWLVPAELLGSLVSHTSEGMS